MTAMEWLDNESARAAKAAMRVLAVESCYLYFRPGRLEVAGWSGPDGMELVSSERVPANRDVAGIASWIKDRARSLPCLPAEVM